MKDGFFALIIDDNDYDLECLTAALKSTHEFTNVMCRLSGENLNTYLQGLTVLPDVILLDVNMPKISGFEVLEALKADEVLKQIPVIMFSSSTWDKDVDTAKELGAIGFIHKGTSYFAFNKAGKLISRILAGTSKDFLVDLKA